MMILNCESLRALHECHLCTCIWESIRNS